MEDFQQCFPLQSNRRSQCFFLYGQLTSFFYCLLRSTVLESCLPTKRDLESVHQFDFARKTQLRLAHLRRRTQFRKSALGMAKATVDVEKERSKKKSGEQAVTMDVLEVSLNPFQKSARNYLKFVCDGILVQPTRKMDLLKGLCCFDYAVNFHLPKE